MKYIPYVYNLHLLRKISKSGDPSHVFPIASGSPTAAELGRPQSPIASCSTTRWENHLVKSPGKPWENHRKTIGKPEENGGLPSGKHTNNYGKSSCFDG